MHRFNRITNLFGAIGDPISRKRLERRGRATRTNERLEERNIAGRRSLRRRRSSGNEVTHIRIRIQRVALLRAAAAPSFSKVSTLEARNSLKC